MLSMDDTPDNPMPIIDDIDQEPREVHAGQLSADLVFRKGRQQRIVEIPPQNFRLVGGITIHDPPGLLLRSRSEEIHNKDRGTGFDQLSQPVPELEWVRYMV